MPEGWVVEPLSLPALLDRLEAGIGGCRAALADEHEANVRVAVIEIAATAHRARMLVESW